MKSIKLISLALSMNISLLTFGQEKVISGIVTDGKEVLIGVSIVNNNSKKATQTDLDGHYSIKANSEDVLIFSLVGFKDKQVFVGASNIINLTLSESEKIQEIMPYYGVPRRKNFNPGTQIKKEDIEKDISISKIEIDKIEASQNLNNKKLDDYDTKKTIKVVVPNTTNTTQTTEKPLFVVDGLISTENVIKDLNPNNIASINVIKAPSATAIYGSKGVNGAILITTKNLSKKELRKLRRYSERDYEKQEKEKVIIPLQNRI